MYRITVYQGSDVKEYEAGEVFYDTFFIMNRIQVYTSRTSKVILRRDEEPSLLWEWNWVRSVWITKGADEMSKTYYNLFEQAYLNGQPVWIFIKSYQKEDARDKFIQARGKKTYTVSSLINLTVTATPTTFGKVLAMTYDSGITKQEMMDELPLYRRGELIGWTRERIEKFADGWTAQGGKEAILWAIPTIIDDLELQILELREQVRVLGGGSLSSKPKKVIEDEYSFEV